ncbi:MAG: hypothetical protein MUC87_04235 [Bacteroidia bacterium]|jgi:hypothetical protein|nr:hypothetical protein [Bacteroidia bacterium]
MKKTTIILASLAFLGIASCTSTKTAVIPLSDKLEIEDTYTIIWNGISEAYRYENGNWKRSPSFDYQFNVVQKRYDKLWKSVKSMHRLHPDYNGKAGQRHQTMYFEISYTPVIDSLRNAVIKSSIGNGTGKSDKEYRKIELNMDMPDASKFSPYNKIRITQHYQYETGVLTETVFLYKVKDGKEIPFMKNQETAYFYIRGKLDKAPL